MRLMPNKILSDGYDISLKTREFFVMKVKNEVSI